TQRSITSHGDPRDRSSSPSRPHAVPAFDEGHEFLQKKITVPEGLIGRVDVETAPALWRHNKEVADLVLAAQVFDQRPASRVEQGLFVFADAEQTIEPPLLH